MTITNSTIITNDDVALDIEAGIVVELPGSRRRRLRRTDLKRICAARGFQADPAAPWDHYAELLRANARLARARKLVAEADARK